MRLAYCTIENVNTRATDEGQTAWLGLSETQKKEVLFRATDDIKAAHKQPDQGGVPWGFAYLREAAESRCLFLARVFRLKDVKERAEYLGADSQNDRILSLSGFSQVGLDPVTEAQVKAVTRGMALNEEFVRG